MRSFILRPLAALLTFGVGLCLISVSDAPWWERHVGFVKAVGEYHEKLAYGSESTWTINGEPVLRRQEVGRD